MRDLTGTIARRYRIEEKIGSGGMGEIYQAHDTVLERDVALKRVHPQLADDEERRSRILREARAASAIRHRAIVSIHDVIEWEGDLFIVQELVAGTPLTERVTAPMRPEEFFPVAEECADALATAAAGGVVHCDLKPENIVITETGLPRILDFGIARRVATDTMAPTRLGEELEGSPPFMAPEILQNLAPTTASDIFSLGVVFYEMLTARSPFRRDSVAATITSILTETPLPASDYNPAVTQPLEDLLQHMLAKDPAERLSQPDALLRELRRIRTGGADATYEVAESAYAAAPRSLAIRPFESLTVDEMVGSFSMGLTGAVRARLASMDGQVLDWPSETQASWMLEGTVQRSGDRIRIRHRVVETERGRTVGGDVVEGGVDDIFQLEDRVIGQVARVLSDRCGWKPIAGPPARTTRDAVAYDHYLKGRGALDRAEGRSNVTQAIGLFRQALERDPDFALARAGLGAAFWKRYEMTRDAKWARQAERAALAALVSEELVAEIPATMGTILLGTGRPQSAAREFRRALELDPKCTAAWHGLARAEEAQGDLVAAEETYRRAVATHPEAWTGHNDLGVFLFRHGRFPDALECFQHVVELTSDNARGHSNMGAVYQRMGREEEAIRAYQRSLELRPNALAFSNLATLHRARGEYAEAVSLYTKAVTLRDADCRLWGNLGATYQLMPGEEPARRKAFERAAALAQLELEVNPNEPYLTALRAQYLAELGEDEEARRLVERALALAPEEAEIQYHAVYIYASMQDHERALRAMRKAIAGGFTVEDFRRDPSLARLAADPRFERVAGEFTPDRDSKGEPL